MHPSRPRLHDHVAAEIRQGITAGRWRGRLPGEREFCAEMRTSRSTLRRALQSLAKEGVIESIGQRGHMIVGPHRSEPSRVHRICMLSPGEPGSTRPAWLMDFHHLRGEFAAMGCELELVESREAFGTRVDRALRRLCSAHPADLWLLRLSTEPIQRWFAEREVPTLVLGHCFPGIGLTHVGVNLAAVGSHAVGVAVAKGHQRIALLLDEAARAGDWELERGFNEAVAAHRGPPLETQIVRHGEGSAAIEQALNRLMRRKQTPTVLLVAQATVYLTVATWMRDSNRVALVALNASPFLDFVWPRPATYQLKPKQFADALLRRVKSRLSGETTTLGSKLLLPRFVPGPSLFPPPES